MTAIYFDASISDNERRRRLYNGDLLVYSASPATRELCAHARHMIETAFAPHDPLRAHEVLPVERCVQILAELKPRFIHHHQSKELLQKMLVEFDCDAGETYFDVPRLRSAMPSHYLTSGIAYAFHPHRDTWYSAPSCQVNWWLPVYEIASENSMAFHTRYWQESVRNSSSGFNYYRWNAESRKSAAQHIKTDTRIQPHAEQSMELDPQLRLLCEAGGAILFSAAQMHSTVPNTSGVARFSIDFRTVNVEDARTRRGAPNVDSACTGTNMRDYLRVRDFSHLSEHIIALYDSGAPEDGIPHLEAALQ